MGNAKKTLVFCDMLTNIKTDAKGSKSVLKEITGQ
jgi:hypothetical protein